MGLGDKEFLEPQWEYFFSFFQRRYRRPLRHAVWVGFRRMLKKRPRCCVTELRQQIVRSNL